MGSFKRRENNFRDRDSDRKGPRDYSSSRGGFRDRDSSRARGMFDRDSGRRNRFDRDSEFKPHRPRDGPRRQPLEMFTVICDKCGKECEVPFKPTSSKPVYCRECFGKDNGGFAPRGRSSGGMNSEQIELINRK
ncbi:hypothetical protein JXB27_02260, partial [Candidatus Woesearchaeota archaeon]|nr:hypothetical protein [Candidatus Woesearchaeota archaeon]